nr:MAG TPA: protein of unknown function DUF4748 [Caudoviricetes sp.]
MISSAKIASDRVLSLQLFSFGFGLNTSLVCGLGGYFFARKCPIPPPNLVPLPIQGVPDLVGGSTQFRGYTPP